MKPINSITIKTKKKKIIASSLVIATAVIMVSALFISLVSADPYCDIYIFFPHHSGSYKSSDLTVINGTCTAGFDYINISIIDGNSLYWNATSDTFDEVNPIWYEVTDVDTNWSWDCSGVNWTSSDITGTYLYTANLLGQEDG
jgi:hypothetical protein